MKILYILFIHLILQVVSSVVAGSGSAFVTDKHGNSAIKESYKCYRARAGEVPSRSNTCVGRICYKATHIQSGSGRLYCLDTVETEEEELGCKKILNGMPGQEEYVCACKGDYCNAAMSPPTTTLLALLSMAMLSVVVGLALSF